MERGSHYDRRPLSDPELEIKQRSMFASLTQRWCFPVGAARKKRLLNCKRWKELARNQHREQGRSTSSFSCSSASVQLAWTSQYLPLASRPPSVYGSKPSCTEASLYISVRDVREHTHICSCHFSVISMNSPRLRLVSNGVCFCV